jgi:hypothetical protein
MEFIDAHIAELKERGRASDRVIKMWKNRRLKKPPLRRSVVGTYPSYTVGELRRLERPPLTYLPLLGQSGYFVEGMTHLLAASPKAGKTELMVACIKEWCAAPAEPTYDEDVIGNVAYFSEESTGVWAERLKNARLDDDDESFVVIPAMGMMPEALLLYFKSDLRVKWASVIVLDTLRAFGAIKDESDPGQMAEAVKPWIEFCQQTGKTLFVLHHLRKAGGQHGEGISGGHGLPASFDIILEMARDSSSENRRAVSVMGRLVEPQKGIYERVQVVTASGIPTGSHEMRWVGERKAASVEAVKPRVLAVLLREEKQTTTQVRESLAEPKPSTDQVVRALRDLCEQGLVERTPPLGQDAAGKTVRWRRLQDE